MGFVMLIVIEPTARFHTHTEVNAGWLDSLIAAESVELIFFFSSFSHWRSVRKSLTEKSSSLRRIRWFPQTTSSIFLPILLSVEVLRRCQDVNIFFLSGPSFAAELRVALNRRNIKFDNLFAVVHTELEEEGEQPAHAPRVSSLALVKSALGPSGRASVALWPENWVETASRVGQILFRPVKRVLKSSRSPEESESFSLESGVQYILMSKHIEIPGNFDRATFRSINMPFTRKNGLSAIEPSAAEVRSGRLKLATIGNGNRITLLSLFAVLEKIFPEVERQLSIEALTMNSQGFDRYNFVKSYRGGRIPRRHIDSVVETTDFLIFSYGPSEFRRSASGSITEIFRYGVPHISLRTPQLEHLHKEFGEIGIMCDSLDELAATIVRLARSDSLSLKRARFKKNLDEGSEKYFAELVSEISDLL